MSISKTTLWTVLGAALFMSVTAYGISSAVDTPRTLMSPIDYGQAKKSIEADTKAALGKCRDDADPAAREICKAQARADERIRKADLDAQYHGTVAAGAEARLARAKAHYEVAKARCSAEHGEGKIVCLRNARADKARALTEARTGAAAT